MTHEDLINELLSLTRAQLLAARTLDGETLLRLAEERQAMSTRLEEALQGVALEAIAEAHRPALMELRSLEIRLTSVSREVLGMMDAAMPARPVKVYSRRGLAL